MFRFERLEAWQLARQFNRLVYQNARKFPKEEMFGLTSQIRRASVSISSNIAEGSGRNSDTDFAHFLEIAYGSLMETVSQCYLAFDEGYLSQEDIEIITYEANLLAAKIVALSKSLGRSARIGSKGAVEGRGSKGAVEGRGARVESRAPEEAVERRGARDESGAPREPVERRGSKGAVEGRGSRGESQRNARSA